MSFERVAIVTGGASGIGFAITERLAADNNAVAIFDRDGDAAGAAAAKIVAAGGAAIGLQVDVTDREQIDNGVVAVRERFGALGAMRPEMSRLREATGQAVTASALVEGAVTVLEVLQGRTLIEFGIRPGARLEFRSSAHGLVALAFSPPSVLSIVANSACSRVCCLSSTAW